MDHRVQSLILHAVAVLSSKLQKIDPTATPIRLAQPKAATHIFQSPQITHISQGRHSL
jgi:hypothetical protein